MRKGLERKDAGRLNGVEVVVGRLTLQVKAGQFSPPGTFAEKQSASALFWSNPPVLLSK